MRASVHPDRRGHLVRGPGGGRGGVALDRQRIAAAERHGHELRRSGDVRHVVLGARLLELQARLGKRHVASVDHDDVAILVEHHGPLADAASWCAPSFGSGLNAGSPPPASMRTSSSSAAEVANTVP